MTWERLNFEQPPNQIAALTAALILAITAPDHEVPRAIELANQLAQVLTPQEIEQAKAAAREHLD